MSLWDELPGSAHSGGALDTIETALQNTPGIHQQPDLTDDDGTWHIYTDTVDLGGHGLSGAGTPIEFRDPHVTLTVGRHVGDDGWRVDLRAPVVAIALPFLTPARYDVANALLVPDTSQRGVFLVVGGLTVRLQQLQGQDVKFSLVSASTSGDPTDKIYDLIRMEPGYAIVGPGNAVGFGFRGAVLDLSDTAGPSNLPAGARTMPNSWQGFFLPEIRLFVQPNGLDGLHVTAAARDLYIGVGASAGVTGIFEVEVVNGASLSVEASFLTPTGPVVPAADGSATVPASSTLIVSTHGGSGSNTITITPDNASRGDRRPRGDHDGRRRHVDHRRRARRHGRPGQDPDPAHRARGRRRLRIGFRLDEGRRRHPERPVGTVAAADRHGRPGGRQAEPRAAGRSDDRMDVVDAQLHRPRERPDGHRRPGRPDRRRTHRRRPVGVVLRCRRPGQ